MRTAIFILHRRESPSIGLTGAAPLGSAGQ
jgi:hypothetical protein